MSQPLVSVVIGTYNRAEYIRETLDSVFAQTYPNFEVVVVDDASTDGTVEILRSYGDRLRLIVRTENSKTAEIPRYEAVCAARGEWCALLDSDDIWSDNKTMEQMMFMQRHGLVLSHTYVRTDDVQTGMRIVRHEGAIPPTGMIARDLLEHCFISTSSVIVRRNVWLEAQNPYKLCAFGTEWDFFLAIAKKHNVGFLPMVLVDYRRGAQGVSFSKWRRAPQDVGAIARIYRNELWKGVVGPKEMRRIMQRQFVENTQYWQNNGFSMRSMYFCIKGILLMPYDCVLYVRLLKTIGCLLFRRREMRRRRSTEK